MRLQTNERWVRDRVETLPPRWRKRLLSRHDRMLSERDASVPEVQQENVAMRAANVALRSNIARLKTSRLPLDAQDEDIRQRAAWLASECRAAVLSLVDRVLESGDATPIAVGLRALAMGEGVLVPWHDKKEGMRYGGAARMMCDDWWRRKLRTQHAKAVEGAAIELGYVNKSRDCYVSNESLARRQQQMKRNQRMLENIVMRNELEQEYTVAELAATGTANKSIRRAELMTRISGFERIAKEMGHGCLFITPTCPSRMHKWRAGNGAVAENPKYDGTTPKEAQAYMSRVWARVRAKLARVGVKLYGFRIAEPHHDGCPHWHILVFIEKTWRGDAGRNSLYRVAAIFRRYFLADAGDEAGAKANRCKAKILDLSAGSAAGYIAKYVSKNIDGFKVGEDLFGNPAMESCLRVEAWAATWGIRQFQQIGGAPVGVWRELRRVKEVPEDAPEHLVAAHHAVNKIPASEDMNVEKGAAWDAYVQAQGGPFIGRDYKIRVAVEESGDEGRYGEAVAPRPVGVVAAGVVRCLVGAFMGSKWVEVLVRSVRHAWEVVSRAGRRSAPWTRVNNCTQQKEGASGIVPCSSVRRWSPPDKTEVNGWPNCESLGFA